MRRVTLDLFPGFRGFLLLGLAFTSVCRFADADVIVLSNRTGRELPVRFMPVNGLNQSLTLKAGENLPLYSMARPTSRFRRQADRGFNCSTRTARISSVARTTAGSRSRKLASARMAHSPAGTTLPGTRQPRADGHDPRKDPRRRRRAGPPGVLGTATAAASRSGVCHLRKVLSRQIASRRRRNLELRQRQRTTLHASLSEFEREVKPTPARLAIGFTSQWQIGTRPHRTWPARAARSTPTSWPARATRKSASRRSLEYLIHEMGHFLGAAHCPERDSVMRPVLGDNQAGRSRLPRSFRSRQHARDGDDQRRNAPPQSHDALRELSPDTRKRLGQIYMELARAMPDDPAAFHYAQLVRSESARHLVDGDAAGVAANRPGRRRKPGAAERRAATTDKQLSRRQGDELTEYLRPRSGPRRPVARRPASASKPSCWRSPSASTTAQLSAAVHDRPASLRAIESPSERTIRLAVLGEPTMRGRRDLAQHFFVSAHLTASTGAEAAQAAGLAKELVDAQRPSGFSFADLAADRAGARFARSVVERNVSLGVLGHHLQSAVVHAGS